MGFLGFLFMLVLIPTLFVLVFILNLVFRVRNAARNTFRREPKREQPRYDYDESDNPITDEIREEIDKVLATKPQDFNRFLQLLLEDEYEIKRGKYLSIRQKDRKNFVRFKSLGTEYSEEKIRAVIAGDEVGELPTSKRKFDLLIDVQEKLRQGKGRGYELWGKKFNNKAITNTLLYLSEKGIRSYEDLKEKADASAMKFRNLTDTIKSAEQKMAEITELKKTYFICFFSVNNLNKKKFIF